MEKAGAWKETGKMGKTNVRMLVIASVFTAMILLTVMFPFLRILNELSLIHI